MLGLDSIMLQRYVMAEKNQIVYGFADLLGCYRQITELVEGRLLCLKIRVIRDNKQIEPRQNI